MRRILLILIVVLTMSSVALAAPMTNLEKGEGAAGYLYWNPKAEISGYGLGKSNANGFYLEKAVSDKIIVGLETIKGSKSAGAYTIDARFTDLTVQYKVDKNVRLIAGNRNYDTSASIQGFGSFDDSTNKAIIGFGASTSLGDKATAYTTLIHSSEGTDWQIGASQELDKNVSLNINYRYYDGDDLSLKGIGAGLLYKF